MSSASATHNIFRAVEAFNALPRPPKAPSGLVRNVWHFSIRRVPIPPEGDVLFLVNPEAHYVHIEGPIKFHNGTHLTNFSDTQATLTVTRLLLKAFVEKVGNSHDERATAMQPWQLYTNDEGLAQRIGEMLARIGVHEAALHTVDVGDAAMEEVADEDWVNLFGTLTGLLQG